MFHLIYFRNIKDSPWNEIWMLTKQLFQSLLIVDELQFEFMKIRTETQE